MHFLIRLPRGKKFDSLQEFYSSPPPPDPAGDISGGNLVLYFMDVTPGENFHRVKYDNRNGTIIFVLGDMIIPPHCRHSHPAGESFSREFFQHFSPDKLREMKGFFYIIQVETQRKTIKVYSSLFNILPVYYAVTAGRCHISSGIEPIRQACPFSFTINKKFLVEKLLFNYALFNDTIIKEIRLLPANSYLESGESGELGNNLMIKKHTTISDYFVATPTPWKKALGDISDLYLEMIPAYFPDHYFYMTLTGGFDGRTNVAAALKYHKDFAAFSYGSADNPDILIPWMISKELGIRYQPFLLDDRYAQSEFIPNSVDLVERTEANAGISRAHYLYVARQLGRNSKYILTGNFGSELLRSMHILGVMVSPPLFNIFSAGDPKELEQTIINDANLRFLRLENFKNELNELVEDIIQYRKNFQPHFTLNQNFYVYMFEEVFRKYFGPEIILQTSCQLYNRSPFLDFDFIRGLLKTELAGVNSGFWESNPLARFRGQVLYAHIIQKAFPGLAQFLTERLYRPVDFFSLTGKMNIAVAFFFRKYLKKQPLPSPAYNHRCYQTNMEYFKRLEINTDLFAEKHLQDFRESGAWVDSQDLFSHLMSLIIYLSQIK
ncbi:MAG TPA: hypothetical protein VK186_02745 [Candidatus Deferrimicrobium sp.]|nr:hypothetical protein [Candidatus Deferrimicrobium sp.]